MEITEWRSVPKTGNKVFVALETIYFKQWFDFFLGVLFLYAFLKCSTEIF